MALSARERFDPKSCDSPRLRTVCLTTARTASVGRAGGAIGWVAMMMPVAATTAVTSQG